MKLRTLRLARAISIEELAKEAGVAYTTIANIEKGISQPRRYEPVRKIAIALGVVPQEIDEFQHLVGTPEEVPSSIVRLAPPLSSPGSRKPVGPGDEHELAA